MKLRKMLYSYTIFTMLHTSFKLETLLKVINHQNSFLEKKNCVNTRPSSDFSRCHTKSPSQFHCALIPSLGQEKSEEATRRKREMVEIQDIEYQVFLFFGQQP